MNDRYLRLRRLLLGHSVLRSVLSSISYGLTAPEKNARRLQAAHRALPGAREGWAPPVYSGGGCLCKKKAGPRSWDLPFRGSLRRTDHGPTVEYRLNPQATSELIRRMTSRQGDCR